MARDQLLPVFTDTAGHQRVYKKKWRIEYASSSVAACLPVLLVVFCFSKSLLKSQF